MILKTFREHNMLLADKVGLEYSAGTLLRYETTLKHTNEFIKWKYQHDDIDIVMLDNEFMMDFELWYRRVRNYNHNTAVKNLANLKRIVRLCVAKGWLQQDPFNTFKSSRREVSGLAPSEIEIARISNAEVGVGRFEVAPKSGTHFCTYMMQNGSSERA
jgi:site-specific recombinase XerD